MRKEILIGDDMKKKSLINKIEKEIQSFDVMVKRAFPEGNVKEEDNKSLTVDEIRKKFIIGSRESKKGRR